MHVIFSLSSRTNDLQNLALVVIKAQQPLPAPLRRRIQVALQRVRIPIIPAMTLKIFVSSAYIYTYDEITSGRSFM